VNTATKARADATTTHRVRRFALGVRP